MAPVRETLRYWVSVSRAVLVEYSDMKVKQDEVGNQIMSTP